MFGPPKTYYEGNGTRLDSIPNHILRRLTAGFAIPENSVADIFLVSVAGSDQ
jgi:hypothetical protein